MKTVTTVDSDELPVDPRLIVVVAVPLLVIAGLFLVNYYTVATGEEVELEIVEPIDPRDVFRGQYATLSYNISNMDLDSVGGDDDFDTGDTVYVVLEEGQRYHDPVSVHRERPDAELCIRGEVTSTWRNTLRAEYGIEEFFADPDRARAIETARWEGDLSATVVVDSRCRAVLRKVNLDGEEIEAE